MFSNGDWPLPPIHGVNPVGARPVLQTLPRQSAGPGNARGKRYHLVSAKPPFSPLASLCQRNRWRRDNPGRWYQAFVISGCPDCAGKDGSEIRAAGITDPAVSAGFDWETVAARLVAAHRKRR